MAVPSSARAAAPAWLEERFPKRSWETLQRCCLRVHPDQGAGLELEEGPLGYHVDAVGEFPGQDEALRAGCILVAVGGERLLGLEEGQVPSIFGEHYQDGVELLFIHADELREAAIERDANAECPCEEPLDEEDNEPPPVPPEENANYELLRRQKSETERVATVRIPVGRSTAWSLPEDTAASLNNDLEFLGTKFGLSATAHLNRHGSMDSVVLVGLPSAIACARPEVVQVLSFYREGKWAEPEDLPQPQLPKTLSGAGGLEDGGDGDGPSPPLQVPEHVKDLRQFKYHDHTADIIVHSWGRSLEEALAQVVVGMFQYMTELDAVELTKAVEVEAQGHDMLDLLYHLLDEFLFVFSSQMHVSRCVEILEFDAERLHIRARGYGERMDLGKHAQGTEIKAITMHMMRILGPDTVQAETGIFPRAESGDEVMEDFPHEVYVLLDI